MDEILFLKGLGDYTAIHLKEKKVLTLEKMKHFEISLPSEKFIRIHKSYLIAIDKINFIERNRVVIGEEWLPIGATYKNAFWERIE